MKRPHIDPKGAMVIDTVDFEFRDSRDFWSRVLIRFCHDRSGKPEVISVFTKQKRQKWSDVFVIDNRNGRYKPCATHAAEIVRTLTHKPPKTNFSRQRLTAVKPELKLFA